MSAGARVAVGERATLRRRRRIDSGRSERVLAIGYVLISLALTTALAWPLFQTPRLVVIAVVAGLTGAAIAVTARRRGWAPWRTALSVALAYVVGVVPLAIPTALSSAPAFVAGIRDGIAGLVVGWKQLLTLELPLGDYQAVLVPFFAIALIGTALALSLALFPSPRATLAVPVVLACGVFGVAFGATAAGSPVMLLGLRIDAPREVLLGTLLVAASLVWLSWRTRLARGAALALATSSTATLRVGGAASVAAAARRRVLAGVLVTVSVVAGMAAVPAFADASLRTTLRTDLEPQLVLRSVISPLGSYRAAFDADTFDRELFTITGDLDGIDRVGLATLDRWNGQQFSVSADDDATRFTRLPGGDPPAGAQSVDITIGDGYTGIWMPLPSGLQSAPTFEGERAGALADAFYTDRSSGAGIDIVGGGDSQGLQPGDAYRVDVPASGQTVLGAPATTGSLDLERHPQMAAWIDAQNQPRTAAGLEELILRLRERGYLSHSLASDESSAEWTAALQSRAPYAFRSSYAGHSTARIEELFRQLIDQQNRVGDDAAESMLVAAVGDDEQFAAAAALLARARGYDARVVVGVRLVEDPDSGVTACDAVCTWSNLGAWVEVRSPGAARWSVVDVTPQFRQQPVLVNVGRQLPKNPTVPEQTEISTAQPPTQQRDDREAAAAQSAADPGWWAAMLPFVRAAGLALLALLLLALPVLVLLAAKQMRRRMRRSSVVAEVSVLGSWEELTDAWADWQVGIGGVTRRERALSSGSSMATELARLVDVAVFGVEPPSPGFVERAWQVSDEEVRRLADGQPWWRLLLAAVNPASLWRPLRAARHRRFVFPVQLTGADR